MRKRWEAFALITILLSFVGCTKKQPLSSEATNTQITVEADTVSVNENDNPIDRAFSKVMNEQKLEGNVIFAYLYALQWRNEYNAVKQSYGNELDYYYSIGVTLESAAYEYGKSMASSNDLAVHFDGIARFYKMLTFDCIAQLTDGGVDAAICAKEEDIYTYLSSVNYELSLDYDNFSVSSLHNTEQPMPPLAGLADEEIYFHHSELGAVLTVKGEQRLFPWIYMTPRLVLPRLGFFDYNGDGEDELAVATYPYSGTGISIEELHIVTQHYFSDIVITSQDISDRLFNKISATYDAISNEIKVTLDDQTLHIDVSDVEKKINPNFGGTDFDSIISFGVDDDKLSVDVTVGLWGFDFKYTPFAYFKFYADISLDENYNISLSNCRIDYYQ